MQPVQDVVENLIKRNLTGETPFGPAQIRLYMRFELFFAQLGRDFAHEGTLPGSTWPFS
jgi:hypothetical protein